MRFQTLLPALFPLLFAGASPGQGFRWPPRGPADLYYEASFTKTRAPAKETVKALREAWKKTFRRPPPRVRKQEVSLAMAILLQCAPQEIQGHYTTSLKKQSLRMKVRKPKKGEQAPLLGNDWIPRLWGAPSKKGEKNLSIPRPSLERSFRAVFPREVGGAVPPRDMGKLFGDHLIPVLWKYPLPCWAEVVARTMELEKERAVEGKSLLRDCTEHLDLGDCNTRAEVWFRKVGKTRFTLEYSLKCEILMARTRDLAKPLEESYRWRFLVKGKAVYSRTSAAFESVEETVRGVLPDPPEKMLLHLRDQEFTGRIQIRRVPPPDKKKKKKKKRRR